MIINELEGIRKAYGRKRRTVIENAAEAVYTEKKIEETEVVFLMNRFGYARVIDTAAYERNREAAEGENKYVISCKNTGRICVFTNTGQLYTVKVSDIPFGKFRDKGIPIDNISNFNGEKESVIAVHSQTSLNLYRMVFITKLAMMKVVDGGEFDVAKRTVAATKLAEGDEVADVTVLNEQRQVILKSANGFFLKFDVEEIPDKKKNAVGVRGMKLGDDDFIEDVYYTKADESLVIDYKNKPLDLTKMKTAKRDGKGTKPRGL